jgi:hypothetical protein
MGVRKFYLYSYKTGVETQLYLDLNWSITDRINDIPVMSFTITSLNSANLQLGVSIRLYLDDSKAWEGIVCKILKIEDIPGYLFYQVQAKGNSSLASRKHVIETYNSKTTGYIINDLLTKYLVLLGVTAGTIEPGPVMTHITFNCVKLNECLDTIKKQTGLSWWIDKNRQLFWASQTAYDAPWILNSTVQHSNFSQEQNLDNYRNVQYVRGGKGTTKLQKLEVLQKPDGQRKTFFTRFPIAKTTGMILEIKTGAGAWTKIASNQIGVNGLDTAENKAWYWSYDSQTLSQNSSATALTTNDNIRITYYGLIRLFVMVDSSTQISARRAIENYDGEYQNLVVEESIDEIAQGIQFADGLLRNYGRTEDIITFNTEVQGLQVGQLLHIDKPLFGINKTFLINSRVLTPIDLHTISYQIGVSEALA